MDIKSAIEEYSYAVSGLTSPTRRWYAYKLKYFLEWCERYHYQLEDFKPSVIRRYTVYLRSEYKQASGEQLSDYTVHGYLQVVKGFLSWCSKEDGLDQFVSEKTASRIELPRVEKRLIDVFSDDEIKKLFAACDKENSTMLIVRNRFILGVLLDTGARLSEIFFDTTRTQREHTGLLMENVYLDQQDAYIKVIGKGRKEREIALGAKSRLFLYRYIYEISWPQQQPVRLPLAHRRASDGPWLPAVGVPIGQARGHRGLSSTPLQTHLRRELPQGRR